MKKIITTLAIAITSVVAFAQDDIKRPDSYYYQSGIEAYNQQDYEKSLEYFDKELQQNPKNGYAMLWEAYIYAGKEQYGLALSKINQSIKLVPKKDKEWNSQSYAFRGSIQCELGDTVKALEDYSKAFKMYPKVDYIYSKCNILYEQQKYAEVDAELKKAMELDENSAITWVYLGMSEHAKGNYANAIEKYSYAVKLNPQYSSAYSFRADTYIAMNKYKEACQDAISALAIQSDTKAYFQLYKLAKKAMNILTLQLKAQQLKEPSKSKWSYYLGLIKASEDDYVSAEPAFREALKISEYEGGNNIRIYQNLAETLNKLGKYSEALDMTDAALALDSTSRRTWVERSCIFYNQGKNAAAIDNVSNAITFNPDYASLYSCRARYYMYSKMSRNALDDINTAISLDPDESSYLNQRSEIYKAMGKLLEAVADCDSVIARETAKSEDEQDVHSLAFAYARKGCKKEAIPYIEREYEEGLTNGSEYDQACMYSLIGEKEKALQHFEKALQQGFCEFVHIGHDTDLDSIRSTDEFKKLIDEYQKKHSDGAAEADSANDEYIEETTEVPFTKESGIYKVKCTINELPLHFYFDTGASDVTISSVEAQFMLKNGYLKPTDVKGSQYFGTAAGEIDEGTIIVLKKVDFGGLELDNVKASVVHNQKAPLLLGQSVLSRLGRIEIDYAKSLIKITSRKRK